MPKFGKRSRNNLKSTDKKLQLLFNEVIKTYDCSIICGYRNKEDQDKAYHSGNSTKKYPNSRHNRYPSLAVDVAPWPIDWNDIERFYHFGGYVTGIAKHMGIRIRWGGDWDSDLKLRDQKFMDLVHFEIRRR